MREREAPAELVERLRRAEALLRAGGHELEADAVRSVIEATRSRTGT